MKFFVIVPYLLGGLVVAKDCKSGSYYCTGTLLDTGSYQAQLDQAAFDINNDWTRLSQAPNSANWLWRCYGGSNGVVKFIQSCVNGCSDNGAGRDDACKGSKLVFGDNDNDLELDIHVRKPMRIQHELM